jgi:hypothetical protein
MRVPARVRHHSVEFVDLVEFDIAHLSSTSTAGTEPCITRLAQWTANNDTKSLCCRSRSLHPYGRAMGVPVTAEGGGGTGGGARSRQKNCNHCVLIKRRCDRRLPTCSRCADAHVECVYSAAKAAGRPVEKQREHPEARPAADVVRSPFGSDSSLAPGFSQEVNYLDMMNMDAHFGTGGSSIASGAMHGQPLSSLVDADMQMDSFLDLISHNSSDAHHHQTLQLQQIPPSVERPASPAEYEIMRSYEKFSDFCVSPHPDTHLHEHTHTHAYVHTYTQTHTERDTVLHPILTCLR